MSDDLLSRLPDVRALRHSAQRIHDGRVFPLILTTANDDDDVVESSSQGGATAAARWQHWVADNSATLRALLLLHGAILFRGFPLSSASEFDEFSKSFGWTAFPYTAGSGLKEHVVGNVFTANETPGDIPIPLHHEMGYSTDPPMVVFAWCELASLADGETPIVLSNAVYRRLLELEPQFVARLAAEGLCYGVVAGEHGDPMSPAGRSWRDTFAAQDRETAERNAAQAGYSVQWLADGSMNYVSATPVPAIRRDQRTGLTVFFNHVHTRCKDVRFPNGDPISSAELDTFRQVVNDLQVTLRWQNGDCMMVDNMLAMHGRNPFTPPRRVLVSLFK